MNLLLYTEAKKKLARQHGTMTAARLSGLWNDMDIALPDSLFAELGYAGALDDEQLEEESEDYLDDLFRSWIEPALLW